MERRFTQTQFELINIIRADYQLMRLHHNYIRAVAYIDANGKVQFCKRMFRSYVYVHQILINRLL